MSNQIRLHADPSNLELIEKEKEACATYQFAHLAYMSFLRQKRKLMWLKDGDLNTQFYHASIRMRQCHNKIHSITDQNGKMFTDPSDIADSFVDYYKTILGSSLATKSVKVNIVKLGPVVDNAMHDLLLADFTSDDVHKAMCSIAGTKAPGPDGFGSQPILQGFLVCCWRCSL